MLIGKEVTHEYRGRGTVIAVGEGEIVVRFGKDYDLSFPYPREFNHMLRLRTYDPETQAEIDAAVRADRECRAAAYWAATLGWIVLAVLSLRVDNEKLLRKYRKD